MGFLFRVRMACYFAGFCLLYKDYMLAQDATRRQVNAVHQTVREHRHYEYLNQRITALENQKAAAAATDKIP